MKNLLIRTLTGIVFVSLIIGSAVWNAYSFAGLFLVVTLLSVLEFYRLFRQRSEKPQSFAGIGLSLLIYLTVSMMALGVITTNFLPLVIPFAFLPFIFELYRKQSIPFTNIALSLLPVLLIALPLALLNFLFMPTADGNETTAQLLIGFFILIWTNDTMAYLGGWALGRHRLFERISPKKSWEGSIIGCLFALGMSALLSVWFTELRLPEWLGMAFIIVVAGSFGDLIESLLKRSLDVKDSGSLLPGHGGFLDRFDSVFLASPFVYAYIHFIHSIL